MRVTQITPLRLTAALILAATVPVVSGAEISGVSRFRIVNEKVLRGAQPTEAGFRSLKAAGVKTILNLRQPGDHTEAEKKLVEKLGMKYVSIPMKGLHTPTEDQISKAMKVLHDEEAGPVFVHCKKGKDRTGVVIGAYRMKHDGWNAKKAVQEARGIGMSWFQFPLIRYLQGYQPNGKGGDVDVVSEPEPLAEAAR
jgi:tyrosine-protein phosphatase SIW14